MAKPIVPQGPALAAASFAVNGALYGGMLSRYAQIAADTGAGPAAFGTSLTAGALGGLAGSVLAPWVLRRFGEARVVTAAGCLYAVLSVTLPMAGNALLLGAALLVVGIVDGGHDVSMNALTVRVQHRTGRRYMGRVHALWSLALALGAAAGAASASVGIPPLVHLTAAGVLALVVQLAAARRAPGRRPVAAEPGPGTEATVTRPRHQGRRPGTGAAGSLLAVVAVAAIAASYVEGPAQDWSAILLTELFRADPGPAAAAPFAFSTGLLCSRLALDPVRRRVSAAAIASTAAVLVVCGALLGLGAALVAAPPWTGLLAIALTGLGAGPVYPLLFDTADTLAERHSVDAGTTAGVISTCSRVGAISAPAIVGHLAATAGLTTVFVIIAAAGAVLVPALRAALRPGRGPGRGPA